MSEQGAGPVWAPPDAQGLVPDRRSGPATSYYGVPGAPPPGWPQSQPRPTQPAPAMSMTSGLFPSGPSRPIYREALPVRPGSVSLGVVAGLFWMMLFGLLASSARGYAWLTLGSGLLAGLIAILLGRLGDRGIAVGVAIAAGAGIAVAMIVVLTRAAAGQWLLW